MHLHERHTKAKYTPNNTGTVKKQNVLWVDKKNKHGKGNSVPRGRTAWADCKLGVTSLAEWPWPWWWRIRRTDCGGCAARRGLARGHLEDGSHLGVHGEALAHAHADLGVDPDAVVFDTDVVLQGGFGLHQARQRQLRGFEALLEQAHRLPDLSNLPLEPENSHTSKIRHTQWHTQISHMQWHIETSVTSSQ